MTYHNDERVRGLGLEGDARCDLQGQRLDTGSAAAVNCGSKAQVQGQQPTTE
jgi:hypothetical protein